MSATKHRLPSLVAASLLAAPMLLPGATAQAARPWQPDPPSGKASSIAGSLELEAPTLHSLGVRWAIGGDDNGNASVAVAYRKRGEEAWREGYPLFWIHPARQPEAERVTGGRLFAGSIVDLEPGTRYEIRLRLTDPDGGAAEKHLEARTRPVPDLPDEMRRVHVMPGEADGTAGTGTRDAPVRGLARALAGAAPGDLLLLGPGTYRLSGGAPARSGTPDRPIVIRGTSPDEVVLDGGGGDRLLELSGRSDIWLEGTTLRNARILVRAEEAHRLVVRGNRFEIAAIKEADGLSFLEGGSTGFLVTDNVFIGPNKEWPRQTRHKTLPDLLNGIAVSGSGHDIAFNEISRVGDGINAGRGHGMRATDIYNNDIHRGHNECIEADYAATNVRVYRNRLTNCLYGISTQPAQGGPVYIFRNMIYNSSEGPIKLHNHTSGVLLFHNTSVQKGFPIEIRPGRETVNDVVSRNNIFVGTRGPALRSTGRMIRSDFDNDGFAYGIGRSSFARWNRATFRSPLDAKMSGKLYARHGAIMLMGNRLFADGPAPARGKLGPREPGENRPLLRQDSRAEDRGVRLANFNDGFLGERPDIGCCELGRPLPHVGPRRE